MKFAGEVASHVSRVLIVDDERHNRDLLAVMLDSEGFELRTAASAAETLDLITTWPPDLIVLDVVMPGMDGCALTIKLKSAPETRSIPVIMVTAMDDRLSRIRGLSAGAEDFLTKPIDRAELCVRVRNLLRLKALGDFHDKYSQMLEGEVVARTSDLDERTTELARNTSKMRMNEARANYTLEVARIGVWEVDLVTQEITWSATMAPMFGLRSDQAPVDAAAYLALIHPDDRAMVKASMVQAARSGTEYEITFRVLWPDGTLHWLGGRGRMVRDGEGNPIRMVGIGIDVSDQKALEGQLRQSQKMEAIGALAGGVAHDFNNLLTAILGFANLVNDTFAPQDERRADMGQILLAGQRASGLTRQLLAFGRKQVLQPTAVDLNALVTGMLPMLRRLITEEVELVPMLTEAPCPVRADRGQLEQVLLNLVVNARDAMPGGGTIQIRTSDLDVLEDAGPESTLPRGHYGVLEVIDTGGGMSEETKARLFEPFFTTKAPGKGTGLGLATVYGIATQSGGHVRVRSALGRGAAFQVYLPCTTALAPAATQLEGETRMPRGHESVLLVEDEAGVRRLTRRLLEHQGYRIVEAADPREAEAICANTTGKFDLLLTDVIMPGMNGPKLFERLSRGRPALKVLYVSGYTDDAIVDRDQLGVGVRFLQKPFTAEALGRLVREVLDQ